MPQGGAHRWNLPVAQSLRNHLNIGYGAGVAYSAPKLKGE